MMTDIDVLASVIEQSGLRGRIYCRSVGRAPWGLDFDGEDDGALFHLVLGGACWFVHRGERRQLVAGDVVLLPRGGRHSLVDHPRSPRVALGAWLRQVARDIGAGKSPKLGSSTGAETEVLCGVYAPAAAQFRQPVLELLPDVLHLRARGSRPSVELGATVSSLEAESAMGARGSTLIVSRLLDILFVQIVRAWADASSTHAGWIGALRDPVLARALAAMHAAPATPWDVASLAQRCGSSRATLARKFRAQVGQPPLAYLTQLRLDRAAHRLVTSGEGLAAVAASVGYASEFAFSRAFKRAFGKPPTAFREAARPRHLT